MDVLMEPGRCTAPPKWKKRVAKRSKDPKPQGKIEQYFAQICIPKEWHNTPMNGGAGDRRDGGGGAALLKRKGDLSMEVLTQSKRSRRAEKLSVEDNLDVEEHTNSMVLGAKSGGGEDPTDRLQLKEGTGLDLITLAEKDGRNGGLGLDEMKTKFT